MTKHRNKTPKKKKRKEKKRKERLGLLFWFFKDN